MILNTATIERGDVFYFNNNMTPAVAGFLEALDHERIETGKVLGIKLYSLVSSDN